MPSSEDSSFSKSSQSFYPIFGVNNIKNSIPIILDRTDGHYPSWMELFNIHACVYNVLDHINPQTKLPVDVDDSTWLRLDAIVKQWIFATISPDLRS